MKLNISNLREAIYLNEFTISQNIELQIMAIWVHGFELFNAEGTIFRTASIKHTSLKSVDKKNCK